MFTCVSTLDQRVMANLSIMSTKTFLEGIVALVLLIQGQIRINVCQFLLLFQYLLSLRANYSILIKQYDRGANPQQSVKQTLLNDPNYSHEGEKMLPSTCWHFFKTSGVRCSAKLLLKYWIASLYFSCLKYELPILAKALSNKTWKIIRIKLLNTREG